MSNSDSTTPPSSDSSDSSNPNSYHYPNDIVFRLRLHLISARRLSLTKYHSDRQHQDSELCDLASEAVDMSEFDDVEDEESIETIKQLRVRELNQAHEEAPAVAGAAILNVADMYS